MWDVRACRSCLASGCKLERVTDPQKRIFNAISGLEFDEPGYPTYLCSECWILIKKALTFRRKCRRAYFSLQVIMRSKSEVLLEDIIQVNRKKISLESSISLWNMKNSGHYTMKETNDFPDNLPADIYKELLNYPLQEIRPETEIIKRPIQKANDKTQIIDIRPVIESCDNHNEDMNADDFMNSNDDFGDHDDNEPRDGQKEFELEDGQVIDLNNVFAGLPEADNETKESESEEEVMKIPKVKKEKKITVKEHTLVPLAKDLTGFSLRVLSETEQREVMQQRLDNEAFVNAHFRCILCATPFENLDLLKYHVDFHNLSAGNYNCHICQTKFKSNKLLNHHRATMHRYLFSCKKCDFKCYTTDHLQEHALEHAAENKDKSRLGQGDRTRPEDFLRQIPVSQKEMVAIQARLAAAVAKGYSVCRWCLKPYKVASAQQQRDFALHEGRHRGRRVTTGKQYRCDICPFTCVEKPNITAHMMRFHLYKYECTECQVPLESRALALIHLNEKHEKNKRKKFDKVACQICGKLVIEWFIKKHMAIVHLHPPSLLTCSICADQFNNEMKMFVHQVEKHGTFHVTDSTVDDSKGEKTCFECGITFVDKSVLDKHALLRGHESAQLIPNACFVCKEIFSLPEELKAHVCDVSKNVRYPSQCPFCPKILTQPNQRELHFQLRHSVQQHQYRDDTRTICELCGRLVKTLGPHIALYHRNTEKTAEHNCGQCSIMFPSVTKFMQHMISNHVTDAFQCKVCLRRFFRRHNCRDHILRVHKPECLFKCKICSKNFFIFSRLSEHSRKIHKVKLDPPEYARYTSMTRRKLHLYPLMQIDASCLKPDQIKDVQLAMNNYLEEELHDITENKEEFLVIDAPPDPFEVKIHKKRLYTKEELKQWSHMYVEPEKGNKGKRKKKKVETSEPELIDQAALGFGYDIKKVKIDTNVADEFDVQTKQEFKYEENESQLRYEDDIDEAVVETTTPIKVKSKSRKLSKIKPNVSDEQVSSQPDIISRFRSSPDFKVTSSAAKVEPDLTNPGLDMPDLDDINGITKMEVDQECIEIDENAMFTMENGDKCVIIEGNLYKIEINSQENSDLQ